MTNCQLSRIGTWCVLPAGHAGPCDERKANKSLLPIPSLFTPCDKCVMPGVCKVEGQCELLRRRANERRGKSITTSPERLRKLQQRIEKHLSKK